MAAPFNLTARLNIQGPFGLKPVIDRLRQNLKNVNVAVDVKINPGINAKLQALNKALAETEMRLRSIQSAASAASKSLMTIGPSMGKAASSTSAMVKSAANSGTLLAKTARGAAEAAADVQWEFGRISGLAIRRFAGFTIATGVIFGFINALKEGVSQAIDFQREMVRISQAAGISVKALGSLEKQIDTLSSSFGVSSKSLVDVSRILVQAGLSANETRIALAALAKTELAPTFLNIQNTTEGAIAAMRQFRFGAGELESALGSINLVAAKFAVESEDIIAAIRRTGGVFAAASNVQSAKQGQQALREFIALFTSVRATTRESAESIATGLRTIFTRLQRRNTVEVMRDFNTELSKSGKFVGPWEAIRRLNAELSKLDPRDIRFAQIIEELGGFRQVGKVIPLITRFKDAEEALQVAMEGQTSLDRDVETAQEALAIRIEQTRQSFLALMRDLTKTDTFKVLADGILFTANSLIKFVAALKPVLPAITALVAVKAWGVFREFTRGFRVGVTATGGGAGAGAHAGGIGAVGGAGAGAVGGAATAMTVGATTKGAAAASTLQIATQNNTTALVNLTAAIKELIARMGGGKKFARGGFISGSGVGDTVPIMAQGGEFVINRGGVGRAGVSFLTALNRGFAGGGKVDPAVVDRILAGGGSKADFEAVLGRPEVAALAQKHGLTKASQLRRGPETMAAFEAVQAAAMSKARTLKSQSVEAKAMLPQALAGPGGAPRVAGIFAEAGASGKIDEQISDRVILSQLKGAKLIPDGASSVLIPIHSAFLDKGRSGKVINGIVGGINELTAGVAQNLGRPIDASDPLIGRLTAGQGVNLQDAAGKLFEAGIKAGLRLESKNVGLDFPNRAQIDALQQIYGPIPPSVEVGDAKLRANGGAYGELRREFATWVVNHPQGLQVGMAGGGRVGAANVALTPGELVFNPTAVGEAGVAGLHKFNRTGSTGGMGSIKRGKVFEVPGAGNSDSVEAQIASGSFVVRKGSAKGFAAGGIIGGAGGANPKSQLNLIMNQIVRMFATFGNVSSKAEEFAKALGVGVDELKEYARAAKEVAGAQKVGGKLPSSFMPPHQAVVMAAALGLASRRAANVQQQRAVTGAVQNLDIVSYQGGVNAEERFARGNWPRVRSQPWRPGAPVKPGPMFTGQAMTADEARNLMGASVLSKAEKEYDIKKQSEKEQEKRIKQYRLYAARDRDSAVYGMGAGFTFEDVEGHRRQMETASILAQARGTAKPGFAEEVLAGGGTKRVRGVMAKAYEVAKRRGAAAGLTGLELEQQALSTAQMAGRAAEKQGPRKGGGGGVGKTIKSLFGRGGARTPLSPEEKAANRSMMGTGLMSAMFMLPGFMEEFMPSKGQTPKTAALKAGITGAIGGAMTGFQLGGGPFGAIAGGLIAGGAAALQAKNEAKLADAQEKMTKSSEGLDKAFQALQENMNPDNLIAFQNAVKDSLAATEELAKVRNEEKQTGLGARIAEIWGGMGVKGLQRNMGQVNEMKAVATATSSWHAIWLDLKRTIGGGYEREANAEIAATLNKYERGLREERFEGRKPAVQQAMAVLAPKMEYGLKAFGGTAQFRGKTGIYNEQMFIKQQSDMAASQTESMRALAYSTMALQTETEGRIAAADAGNDENKKRKIEIEIGKRVYQDKVRQFVVEKKLTDAIMENIKAMEASQEAVRKVGDAMDMAVTDMNVSAQAFANISSVITNGLVSMGDVVNPFENVDVRTPQELAKGIQVLQNAAGGTLTGGASRIPGDIGQAKILGEHLGDVLRDAIEASEMPIGNMVGMSREEAALEAVRSDARLRGVSAAVLEDIESQIRLMFGKRQGETEVGIGRKIELAKEITDKLVRTTGASEEAAKKAFDAIIKGAKQLSDATNQLVTTITAANEKYDAAFSLAESRQLELAEMRGQTVGPAQARLREENMVRMYTSRAGVGGPGGTTDVATIATSITALRNQLLADQRLRETDGLTNTSLFNTLTDNIRINSLRLNDATKALDTLANSTDSLSAIQSELAKIEQKREAGRNLLEKLSEATFNPAAAAEIKKALVDAQKLVMGQGAGTGGGAALLMELANVLGPEVAQGVQTAIDRARLSSLGGLRGQFDPGVRGIRQMLMEAGVGTGKGQGSREQELITAYQTISNAQVAAINAQGQIIMDQTTRLMAHIGFVGQQLGAAFQQALNPQGGGPPRKSTGGTIKGAYRGNKDTEITRLTPGEFVIRRDVAQRFEPQLSMLNAGVPVERAFGGLQQGGFVQDFTTIGAQALPMSAAQARVFQAASARALGRSARLGKLGRGRASDVAAAMRAAGYNMSFGEVQQRMKIANVRARTQKAMARAADQSVKDPAGNDYSVRGLLSTFNSQVRARKAWGDAADQIREEMKGLNIDVTTAKGADKYRRTFAAKMMDKRLPPQAPIYHYALAMAAFKKIPLNNPEARAAYNIIKQGALGGGVFSGTAGTPMIGWNSVGTSVPWVQQWLGSTFGGYQAGGAVNARVTPGEFVVKKNIAASNMGFLQRLNATGTVPSFQGGGVMPRTTIAGMVNIPGMAGGAGGSLVSAEAVSAMGRFAAATAGLASGIGAFAQFASQLQQASHNLQAVNVPSRVTMEVAPIQVNVVVNGVEAFNTMQDSIRSMITQEVTAAMSKHINPITGETKENFAGNTSRPRAAGYRANLTPRVSDRLAGAPRMFGD